MARRPTKLTVRDEQIEGAGGVTLAATRFGSDDGAPVLFLHGFGQTRHAWRNVASRLGSNGWSVMTLDLRGHGDSDWADRYHFAEFEEDVRRAAATFASRPAVVGASFGGILSLVTQADDAFAAALCLVDVVPHFNTDSGRRIQGFMAQHRDGFASLEDAADAIDEFLEHRSRPERADGLLQNLRSANGRYLWKWDPQFASGMDWLGDDIADLDAAAEFVRERMVSAAQGLTIPTLLVRGKASDFVSDEAARAFVDLVPHAEYVDVAGAGHTVAGDRNDAFGDAVEEFLEKHHPGRLVT